MSDDLEENLNDEGKMALAWARTSAIKFWEDGEKCDLHDFEDRVAFLLAGRESGKQFGKFFNDLSTRAMDNRVLEQAFMQGFLETRVKTKTGDHWVPKEGL